MAKQKEDLELAMKRITADNRREICDKERECLTRKQELLRGGCLRAGVHVGPEWTAQPWAGRTLRLPHPKTRHQPRDKTAGKPPLKSRLRQRYHYQ